VRRRSAHVVQCQSRGGANLPEDSNPPFGVAITPDGRFAFVDQIDGRVRVYSLADGRPRTIRTISVAGEAVGCSLTPDGRLLLIADGQGATVVDVARAVSSAPHPVLGSLQPPASAHLNAKGAIETNSSRDGRYVFVSLEYGAPRGAIAVYDLGDDRHPRFGPGDWVGSAPLGQAVVGSALSPSGRQLYVTSELSATSGTDQAALKHDGTLSVLNLARLEHTPAHAVTATIAAGLQPVRDAVSPDGSTVWVTARASNQLLAFSTHRLTTNPGHAQIAATRVGTAPVGLALFDNGRRALIADSNRFNAAAARSALTVVNTPQALAHRSATAATLRAGGFPREIAIDTHDSIALVTNSAPVNSRSSHSRVVPDGPEALIWFSAVAGSLPAPARCRRPPRAG
jgi:DNA-binding beta-propeller fold protein YncE